jgi:Tfp pilus assembly protein PilF
LIFTVGINGGNVSLFIRLVFFSSLAAALSAQTGGVVSVEELRNPLQGKSLRALLTAREHLKSGQRERGLQELREAMSDPMAMPYAISMLGAEHLRALQLDAALSELEQAVRLLPGIPGNHSNLAYALGLKGQIERGLVEARKAFQLDGGAPTTRLVLGTLLLKQGANDSEAIRQLQAAADEAPSAHLVLALHYDDTGKTSEAEHERRAYSITSMSLLAGK